MGSPARAGVRLATVAGAVHVAAGSPALAMLGGLLAVGVGVGCRVAADRRRTRQPPPTDRDGDGCGRRVASAPVDQARRVSSR